MLNLPEGNVTSLAKSVGVFRPSASRCLHYLQRLGLVLQDGAWQLTNEGRVYLERMKARFEPVKDARIHYWEGSVCFDCLCGANEITLSDESEDYHCECGRVYRFCSSFQVSI